MPIGPSCWTSVSAEGELVVVERRLEGAARARLGEVLAEVAVVVERLDDERRDGAVAGTEVITGELTVQVGAQRDRFLDPRADVGRRYVPRSGRVFVRAEVVNRPVAVGGPFVDLRDRSIGRIGDGRRRRIGRAVRDIDRRRAKPVWRARSGLVVCGNLEERVRDEGLFEFADEVLRRQLQQPHRLLQPRGQGVLLRDAQGERGSSQSGSRGKWWAKEAALQSLCQCLCRFDGPRGGSPATAVLTNPQQEFPSAVLSGR